MTPLLNEITYLTRKHFRNADTVLPTEYAKTFTAYAKERGLNMEDEESVISHIQTEAEKFDKIVSQTGESLDSLSTISTNVTAAITSQDLGMLAHANQMLTNMKKTIEELQEEVYKDSLTNVFNRKWLVRNCLEDEKFQTNGVMAFIDINEFKYINDTYGHLLGDQVLKYLANMLKKELKSNDTSIIRYAGDEFIIMYKTNIGEIDLFRDQLHKLHVKLSSQKVKAKNTEPFNFSFSYGLSTYNSGESFSDILSKADEDMYTMKKEGKL